MKQKNKRFFQHKFKLQTTIILIMCCSTLVSLIVSTVLIQNFIIKMNYENVSEEISGIAKIVANDRLVKEKLVAGDPERTIQSYTNDVAKTSKLSFVVVMDMNRIRLSHTEDTNIGQEFSSRQDADKVLSGQSFFSKKKGVLGPGYRYFTPVWQGGKVIGAVCVGKTSESIDRLIDDGQKKIFVSLFLGLFVGILGAIFLAQKIRKILFGLEPEEIAAQLSEKVIIENEVYEGLLAISAKKEIILMNDAAKQLFSSSSAAGAFEVGQVLPQDFYDVLFKKTLEKKEVMQSHSLYLNGIALVASVTPIFSGEDFFGAVATLRDRSEVLSLIDELGGTKQYINSLRAQTHEFMNHLFVISGLIDLARYEDAKEYMQQINHQYKEEVGHITELIKVPAIAGFLLGKINEAKEQQVEMVLETDSYIPAMPMSKGIHALLQILGNLLDNAKEAVMQNNCQGQVLIRLNYEEEGEIFLLEVCDDGVGISQEDHEKLFVIGFSTKGEKRGFGLNIVHHLVARYHGVIEFSPREAGGTKVYLELPKNGGEESDPRADR